MLDIILTLEKKPGFIQFDNVDTSLPKLKELLKDRQSLKDALLIYDVDGKETEIKDMQLGVSLNADKVTFIPSYKPIIEVLKRDGEWAISIPYEVWSPRAEFANGVFFIGLDFKLESFISDKPDLQNIEARLNLILATSTNTIYE